MRSRPRTYLIYCVLVSLAITFCLSLLTNRISTTDCKWDCLHYLGLAEHGFSANPLVSPFAYRYLTPFLAGFIKNLLGIPIFSAFGLIALLGAILQLVGIYLFINFLTKSQKAAYLAMAITALSFFNVKFLLFDVSRPDHFAYPLVVLNFFLALRKRLYPLLFITAIGLQVREFVVLPLIAYFIIQYSQSVKKKISPSLLVSSVFVLLSIMLQRVLIPVSEDGNFISFSSQSFPLLLLVPLNLKRDINILFSVFAYFLPTLLLLTKCRLKKLRTQLPSELFSLSIVYSILVLLLTLYGGTDIPRFVSYLFLPQAIVLGFLLPLISKSELLFMIISVFIFNKIWMIVPIWELTKYLNFYGGFSSVVNYNTLFRTLEMLVFIIFSLALRRTHDKIFKLQTR